MKGNLRYVLKLQATKHQVFNAQLIVGYYENTEENKVFVKKKFEYKVRIILK
jgi:hypothetical protein